MYINIGKPNDICNTKKIDFSSKSKPIINFCLKERSKIQVNANIVVRYLKICLQTLQHIS